MEKSFFHPNSYPSLILIIEPQNQESSNIQLLKSFILDLPAVLGTWQPSEPTVSVPPLSLSFSASLPSTSQHQRLLPSRAPDRRWIQGRRRPHSLPSSLPLRQRPRALLQHGWDSTSAWKSSCMEACAELPVRPSSRRPCRTPPPLSDAIGEKRLPPCAEPVNRPHQPSPV
jgi:hypothetical protein